MARDSEAAADSRAAGCEFRDDGPPPIERTVQQPFNAKCKGREEDEAHLKFIIGAVMQHFKRQTQFRLNIFHESKFYCYF